MTRVSSWWPTTNLCCVTSLKSEDLSYTVAALTLDYFQIWEWHRKNTQQILKYGLKRILDQHRQCLETQWDSNQSYAMAVTSVITCTAQSGRLKLCKKVAGYELSKEQRLVCLHKSGISDPPGNSHHPTTSEQEWLQPTQEKKKKRDSVAMNSKNQNHLVPV